jgi:hypothetical protein
MIAAGRWGTRMGKVAGMMGRFIVGFVGMVLAMLLVRRIAAEARRARMQAERGGRADPVERLPPVPLKQDPSTGVYYPAD